MKVYKVTPGIGLNPCCEKDLKTIQIWVEEAEPGEILTVEILEMSEVEYNKFPEYMGP